METAALQVISAPTLSHMAATQRIIQEDNDDDAGYKVLTSLIYDIDCIFPTFSLNFFSSRCAVLGSWRVPVFWVEVLVSAGENHYQDRWKLILWNYIYHPWVTEEVGTSLPCKQSHLKRETRHLNLVKISQNCENQQFRIPPKIRNSRLWEIRVIVQASILLGRGGEPVLLYTDCRK